MHPAHWSMPNSKREKTMLDPVQQAFEREMQAKEQAKPIRQAGTRRSAELDTHVAGRRATARRRSSASIGAMPDTTSTSSYGRAAMIATCEAILSRDCRDNGNNLTREAAK